MTGSGFASSGTPAPTAPRNKGLLVSDICRNFGRVLYTNPRKTEGESMQTAETWNILTGGQREETGRHGGVGDLRATPKP